MESLYVHSFQKFSQYLRAFCGQQDVASPAVQMGPTLDQSIIIQQSDRQDGEVNTPGDGTSHANPRKRQFPDRDLSNRRVDTTNINRPKALTSSARRHDPSVVF